MRQGFNRIHIAFSGLYLLYEYSMQTHKNTRSLIHIQVIFRCFTPGEFFKWQQLTEFFFFLASVRQDERDHEYSIMTCRINYMNNHSTQAQAGIPTKKERNKERKRKFTWKLEQD